MENIDTTTQEVTTKKSSPKLLLVLAFFGFLFITFGVIGYFFQSANSKNDIETGKYSLTETEIKNMDRGEGLDFSDLLKQSKLSQQYYAVTDFNQDNQDNIDLVMVPFETDIEPIRGSEAVSWGSGAAGLGSSDPLSSPDLKKVAYLDKNFNLHLSSADRIVDIIVSNEIKVDYISGWSKDSNKLIFHANAETLKSRVFPEYPGGETPEKVELDSLEVKSGFFLLDLENNKLVNLSSLGDFSFEDWIDENRMLIKIGGYNNEKFVIFDFSNYVADIKTMDDGLEKDFGTQHDFSLNGEKWALTWHVGTRDTSSASIILADFPSVQGKELMNAEFAQIQAPVISPDGSKVAFRGYDVLNGPLYVYLYDGTEVKKVANGFPRRWVNDNQFIYLQTDPGYASNPRMGENLFLYDLGTNESTLIFKFTGRENNY